MRGAWSILTLAMLAAPPVSAQMTPPAPSECSDPAMSVACEVRALGAQAAPAPDAPSSCDALHAIADGLDLRSFANSTGPRLDPDAVTVPADLFVPHVLSLCTGLVLEEEGWRMAFVPVGTADWTGDGEADLAVVFEDRALDGTYSVTETLIVSGFGGEGPLTATAGCDMLETGEPGAVCADR